MQEIDKRLGIPYIPFPNNAKEIEIKGIPVLEYIIPDKMNGVIKKLAEKINFNNFDLVIVNLQGGVYLFNKLCKAKGVYPYNIPLAQVEYHRPPKGFDAKIDIPVPDEHLGKKALLVDDIYDSGGTGTKMRKGLDPNSWSVALITKRGIDGQLLVPNLFIGLCIDDVWVGGCGMDLGVDGEGNHIRNYPGIVVKPTT